MLFEGKKPMVDGRGTFEQRSFAAVKNAVGRPARESFHQQCAAKLAPLGRVSRGYGMVRG